MLETQEGTEPTTQKARSQRATLCLAQVSKQARAHSEDSHRTAEVLLNMVVAEQLVLRRRVSAHVHLRDVLSVTRY